VRSSKRGKDKRMRRAKKRGKEGRARSQITMTVQKSSCHILGLPW